MKALTFTASALVVIVIFMNIVSGFAQKREEAVENGPSKTMTRDYDSLEKQLGGN